MSTPHPRTRWIPHGSLLLGTVFGAGVAASLVERGFTPGGALNAVLWIGVASVVVGAALEDIEG